MKTNYHTHTYRCKHATGTEEDFVLEAIKNNLAILGLSDHAPFKGDTFFNRMDYLELFEYLDTCFKLKNQYKDKLSIKVGLEIEYIYSQHAYYEYLLNNLNVEYLILGQHFFYVDDEELNTFSLTSTKDIKTYANTIKDALATGYFSLLAHPDVFFINNLKFDDNVKEAFDIIIKAAKTYDIPLEFNANGIRRGIKDYIDGARYPYPYLEFWKLVAKENIKVIISSDCHNPEDLWDENVDTAYKLAKELSLNVIYEI